ncbi:MAG: hypothetical protein OXC40_06460, partial [Proteobacteria bacterium]|nr:hypothetical protein [Pseudomonadota bacterium]
KRRMWHIAWQKAQQDTPFLGSPSEASLLMPSMEKCFHLIDQSNELQARIKSIQKDQEHFAQKVNKLAHSLNFTSANTTRNRDFLELAENLIHALTQAQEQQLQFSQLTEKITHLKSLITEEKKEHSEAITTLQTWCQQAKVSEDHSDSGELTHAGKRSDRKQHLLREKEMKHQEIIRYGDGKTIDDLTHEYGDTTSEELSQQIELLEEQRKQLESQRDELNKKIGQQTSEKNRIDGSSKAAEVSQVAAELAAVIEGQSEEYIRLLVASLILEQQIDSYRDTHQQPILKKASQIFKRLTGGSFLSIEDDLHQGQFVLVGVKHNSQKVRIEAMSTGSRDQLFLALRLAMIEQHLSEGAAMPFTVDDILLGFDDQRARVTLEVLADLAQKTQVILFTHHRHILLMAQDLASSKPGLSYYHLTESS